MTNMNVEIRISQTIYGRNFLLTLNNLMEKVFLLDLLLHISSTCEIDKVTGKGCGYDGGDSFRLEFLGKSFSKPYKT